jgi:hypothetical protein
LETLAAIKAGTVNVWEGCAPIRVAGRRDTPEIFATLGVPPSKPIFITQDEK